MFEHQEFVPADLFERQRRKVICDVWLSHGKYRRRRVDEILRVLGTDPQLFSERDVARGALGVEVRIQCACRSVVGLRMYFAFASALTLGPRASHALRCQETS